MIEIRIMNKFKIIQMKCSNNKSPLREMIINKIINNNNFNSLKVVLAIVNYSYYFKYSLDRLKILANENADF